MSDTKIVRKHVEAVIKMLLGNRRMKPGTAILGGLPLDIDARIGLGEHAIASKTDIVHLAFGDRGPRFALTEITTFAPRDIGCFIQQGCRLWLPMSGNRALILPKPHVPGHFRLSPRELLHINRKPSDIEEGIARAKLRLARCASDGVELSDQAAITELPVAA